MRRRRKSDDTVSAPSREVLLGSAFAPAIGDDSGLLDLPDGVSMAARPGFIAMSGGSLCGPRPNNDDRYCFASEALVVADGMGGEVGGSLAAALALAAAVEHTALAAADGTIDAAGAVRHADERVRDLRRRPGLRHAGCTLTVAIPYLGPDGARLAVAAVGDSPAYLLSTGAGLRRLTRPQTRAQELVDNEVLDPWEVARDPAAADLLRGCGFGEAPVQEIDLRLETGDIVLLASDGLPATVSDDELAELLDGENDPAVLVERLLKAAERADLVDNTTVVVAVATVERSSVPLLSGRAEHRPGRDLDGATESDGLVSRTIPGLDGVADHEGLYDLVPVSRDVEPVTANDFMDRRDEEVDE